MNIYNKLNNNLQEIILKKIFKSNTYKNLINDLNKYIIRWNKEPYIKVDFTEYLFNFCRSTYSAFCSYCKHRILSSGFYKHHKLYPKKFFLNKKKNIGYYITDYINYICYGCYFGYSKKPSKFYIPIN